MKQGWKILKAFLFLLIFWVLLFDFQRILFTIHNLTEFEGLDFFSWLGTFVFSLRLDLATAGFLSLIPILFLTIYLFSAKAWTKKVFFGVLMFFVACVAMIHAGEINAYPEWKHKLTSRVFMHLSNPDEVTRTADYSMTFWFFFYTLLQLVFAWKIMKWLFKEKVQSFELKNPVLKLAAGTIYFCFSAAFLFLFARGGVQQIPININAAFFSTSHLLNDVSVNSTYYFANSYILYKKADIESYIPKVDPAFAKKEVAEWYAYPKEHDNYIFKDKRPNVVMVIMESWAAEAIGCMSETKGATPNFDRMAKEGLLFDQLYATASTSEIGNASIFSGFPAIPDISLSLQPEKHRKLRTINEEFQDWGYSSHYVFSGDLKYGNIGGFFMDHGFQDVIDENNFPAGLPKGKLNYYDEALYKLLLKRINKTKGKFLHCAFTGSTHSPFDHPKRKNQRFKGTEAAFMNSMVYADESLGRFIAKCKKEEWYANTIFIFVADHSHHTPSAPVPHTKAYYRIPLLIFGEPLKEEWRGKCNSKLGSQMDIPATLMYQFGGEPERYPWSKDLMNPAAPEFAFHTIIDGYGWISPKGSFTYQMKNKHLIEQTVSDADLKGEMHQANLFLRAIYDYYKEL
jgi:phosphoglycerol transferase MdoB-like AlkP superfamily enzyme